MNTLISTVTYFLPTASWSVFVLATGTWFYIVREKHPKYFRNLLWLMASLRILYAALATYGQYLIWSSDPKLGPIFLTKSYFPYYVFTHFWLNLLITFAFAAAFWLFLNRLKNHKERFFEEGETVLGALAALIVGWPLEPIFLIAIFLSVLIISVVRGIVFKEAYTTLGAPFLLAAFLCLLAGALLLHSAGLDVLKI